MDERIRERARKFWESDASKDLDEIDTCAAFAISEHDAATEQVAQIAENFISSGTVCTCNMPDFQHAICPIHGAEPAPAEQPRFTEIRQGVYEPNSLPNRPVTNARISEIINKPVAASPAEGPRQNRYWDIFTADDGGRLLRLCWHKNDAGNFMAMEVAELVTWNNAAEQEEAEDFILKALNGIEQSRVWLAKRADGEDKTFLTDHAAQPSPDAAKVKEIARQIAQHIWIHYRPSKTEIEADELAIAAILRPYFPAKIDRFKGQK